MTARLELDIAARCRWGNRLVLRAGVDGELRPQDGAERHDALAAEPGTTLVEARGIFVQPRPELAAAYFGSITMRRAGTPPPAAPPDRRHRAP